MTARESQIHVRRELNTWFFVPAVIIGGLCRSSAFTKTLLCKI